MTGVEALDLDFKCKSNGIYFVITHRICVILYYLLMQHSKCTWADQISDCIFYCKYIIFGTHLVDIMIQILTDILTDWTTQQVCKLKSKLYTSKQPCTKYIFSYNAHSLHIYTYIFAFLIYTITLKTQKTHQYGGR